MMPFLRLYLLAVCTSFLLMVGASHVQAFTALEDEEMSGVTGEGMSFVWTDFRMMFDPGSYFEQMGSPSNNTCTSTGNTASNWNCMRRADLRWFGGNVSSATGATGTGTTPGTADWATSWTTGNGALNNGYMTQCRDGGINGLGCPRGGPIQYFAAPDNPYILRVNTYDGGNSAANAIGNGVVTYQGNTSAADWEPNNPTAGSRQTVLEFLAPASETVKDPSNLRRFSYHYEAQDPYRFSFWGEIESGRGTAGGGLLKSQTIISGNAAGSAMRYYKFTQTTTSPGATNYNTTIGCVANVNGCTGSATNAYLNRTLAIAYDSWLRGDFRFSVAQDSAGTMSDAIGVPVDFHPTEGFYFRNAEVHVPLGQLFYQALTINMPRNPTTNAPVKDGNFTLEVPLLPNQLAVYRRFYSLTNYSGAANGGGCTQNNSRVVAPNCFDDGYGTARAAYLYGLPERGGSTPAYMPARVASLANYTVPDANYAKTHGFVHWGDWAPCNGVGCSVPFGGSGANGATNALDGIGRNAWNSSGDGVFFIGTTNFNAYAYSGIDVDVSTGNTYTAIEYYKGTGTTKTVDVRTNAVFAPTTADFTSTQQTATSNVGLFTNCNAANASDFTTCGAGGSYNGAPSGFNTTTVSQTPAERYWLNSCTLATGATCAGAATNRPMIAVPAGTAVNLGDARIEGLQLNFLRFTSYGALN